MPQKPNDEVAKSVKKGLARTPRPRLYGNDPKSLQAFEKSKGGITKLFTRNTRTGGDNAQTSSAATVRNQEGRAAQGLSTGISRGKR